MLVAWQPSRVAFQTLMLVPSLVDLGLQPLALAPQPAHTVIQYGAAGEERLPADLWLPAGAAADRQVGAIVVVYGVNSRGRAHPALIRVADAVARTGVAVLVPDLPTLDQSRLVPAEVERIVAAFQALAARPEVDPDRVSVVGISAGGSLALRAVADPRIADQVDWIAVFGAYADASEMVADVAAHAYELDGYTIPWEPALLARQVIFATLLELVTDRGDRTLLRDRYRAPLGAGVHPIRVATGPAPRSAVGRAVEAIVTADTLDEAQAAIAASPAAIRDLFAGLTPVTEVAGLRCRVYLMHEVSDHHVPYAQSREMAAALEAAGVEHRLGEFRLFDHVQPETQDLVAAAPELWKLLWYLQGVLADTL